MTKEEKQKLITNADLIVARLRDVERTVREDLKGEDKRAVIFLMKRLAQELAASYIRALDYPEGGWKPLSESLYHK